MADLSRPISYNGWTAENDIDFAPGRPGKGFVVDTFDYGTVPASYYLDKKALQDGADAADIFLGPRTIQIDCAIYGSTQGNMWDRLRVFRTAFSPLIAYNNNSGELGFQPLKFFEQTGTTATWDPASFPSGIPLEIRCRPVSPPTYRVTRDQQGGRAAGGSVIRATARLIARDPRIYLQTSTSISISTSTQTVTNRGNYPSLPVITFGMSAAGSASALFSIDGYQLRLNLASISSGSYSVRYSSRVIVNASGVFQNSLFDNTFDNRFGAMDPSGSVVYGANLTGMTSPTLTFTEAFP